MGSIASNSRVTRTADILVFTYFTSSDFFIDFENWKYFNAGT